MESETEILRGFAAVKKKYGFEFDLKPEQMKAISSIVQKRSVFILLPTGFGKSNCFVLPPLILDELNPDRRNHVSLVVSPLRALMKNQVSSLQEKGVMACAVIPRSEMNEDDINGLKQGKFSVIFISPESLDLQPWRAMLKSRIYKEKMCLIACDEAHCISQWGGDFRPNYKNVSILRSLCDKCPFAMLTATCTEEMKADILDCLTLQDSNITTIAVVPDRPNIFLNFTSKPSMKFEEELTWYIEELKEKRRNCPKTIIYCRTIRDAGELYEHIMFTLKEKAWCGEATVENRLVEMYHSSISKGSESRVLEDFPKVDSKIRCVVATIAFGMGVQIPDIEIIIHWGASKSVLSYMQEIGRGGRDGRRASAYLYANLKSIDKRRTEEDMCTWCQELKGDNSPCMRVGLLTKLKLKGMDMQHLENLKQRQQCALLCDKCQCCFCTCCVFCQARCPCTNPKAERS